MSPERSIPTLVSVAVVTLLMALPTSARAQDLVFQPQVTGFGAAPATVQVNLQLAQAQQAQPDFSSFNDPLQNFQQDLQRQILSGLAQQIIQSQFGGSFGQTNIDLAQRSTFNLGDFIVDIIPGTDALQIRVANTITGNSTTISVPKF